MLLSQSDELVKIIWIKSEGVMWMSLAFLEAVTSLLFACIFNSGVLPLSGPSCSLREFYITQ